VGVRLVHHLRDEQFESDAPTHYDPLTLCEYMGGSGQCTSVLAADYMPTAYFDKDDLARLTYLENNPCSAAHGSLDSVVNDLDNEDSFFRNALGTDVGITGPPCGSFSQANLRKFKSTTADAADLLIECVSLGLQAGHRVFVCENVSGALSVQHGAITARLAALASEHAYVMHICVMDPTKHNGCQTRPRPHFVFVQSALHALRGKFDVPIPPVTGSAPTMLQHLSDPSTPPMDDLRDLHQWTKSRSTHEYTYGWTGQESSSGFCEQTPAALGVFASLDRF
jgi:site-specific DNA-cytosine methylase